MRREELLCFKNTSQLIKFSFEQIHQDREVRELTVSSGTHSGPVALFQATRLPVDELPYLFSAIRICSDARRAVRVMPLNFPLRLRCFQGDSPYPRRQVQTCSNGGSL